MPFIKIKLNQFDSLADLHSGCRDNLALNVIYGFVNLLLSLQYYL
jgi:hypothetical protein